MGRPYRIRDGFAFVLDDKRVTGGERIVLEDDVAAMHAEKIEPISDEQIATERAAAEQAAADRAAAGNANAGDAEA